MNKQAYTIPDYDPAKHMFSNVVIQVKVEGFWSTPITIRLNRDFDGLWHPDVSHSSGGNERQTDDEGYLRATDNLAYALLAATTYARALAAESARLESDYQAYMEQFRIAMRPKKEDAA